MLAPIPTIIPSINGVNIPSPKKSIVETGTMIKSTGSGKNNVALPIIAAIKRPIGPIEIKKFIKSVIIKEECFININNFVLTKKIAFIYLLKQQIIMVLKYEEMLDRAYLSIPKEALKHERFVIPKADSMIQGKKTFVKGFSNLIKEMRRDKKHFLKYLTKETGTSVTESGQNININGKIGAIKLNKIIEDYFTQFVLCSECSKPDTKIISQNGIKFMKCEACGAITPVKGI